MRGRPKADAAEQEKKRHDVRLALMGLLEQTPSQDLNASLLISQLAVSRPTFYKWYPGGLEQVMNELLDNLYAPLISGLHESIRNHEDPLQMAEQAVRTYYGWVRALGSFALCIFREVENPDSVFAVKRLQILRQMRDDFEATMASRQIAQRQQTNLAALTQAVISVLRASVRDGLPAGALDSNEELLRHIVLAGMQKTLGAS